MDAVMQGYVKMREVKVKRVDLLAKIKANRIKHIEEYDKSVEGYKIEAKERVEAALKDLQDRIDKLKAGQQINLAGIVFNLQVPENHTADYDQVIEMLEMSVDEELKIQSDEFACYVMDRWDWKDRFTLTNRAYLAKAGY